MKLRQLRRSEEDEMSHGRAHQAEGLSRIPPPSKTSFVGNRPPKIARENSATLDNYAIVAQKAAKLEQRV